jgi:hypothetical protein
VHPNSRHNTVECREIIGLAKHISERHEQSSKDGSPPRRRPGKERVDDGEVAVAERDLGYQSPEGSRRMSSPETPTPVVTARRATGGTPYSSVYGAEACLPPETLMDSPRVQSFDKSVQERPQRKDVDSIDERRGQAVT